MNKTLTIAVREFKAIVGTKAFLISICMMPVLMFGSFFALEVVEKTGKIDEKKIAVVDPDGDAFKALATSAGLHNAAIDARVKAKERGGAEEDDSPSIFSNKATRFEFERIDQTINDELRLELSEKIRSQQLDAFVEVPQKVDQYDGEGNLPEVVFYSEESGLSDTKGWVSQTINRSVKNKRLARMGIDAKYVEQASTPVKVRGVGLLEQQADGTIAPAVEKDELTAIFLPFGVMMMMFMVIMMSSQPVLESVLEEKSQRIAEVLLGSANPTQLMTGKLLGTVAGSLTIFAIYLCGASFVAVKQGYGDMVPVSLVPWFVVFQILGVMFYASIFMSVASAVSQLKEAQSVLLPVWMLLMSPLFIWFVVVRDPNSVVGMAMSFFPPTTSTMLMLRMATGATIPVWQPLLGLLLLIAATVVCVYLAGRIFRVGILWQGKTPQVTEVFRWAFAG